MSAAPDFVHLSRASRLAPGADAQDRLWSAMFALPAWHFIKAPSPSGWLPFAGFVNGLRCILAFTDETRADGYARFAALVLPGVDSPVLSLTPEQAVAHIPQLRAWGISGIVVDTGPDSFYAPLDALFGMFRRLGKPHHKGEPPAPLAIRTLGGGALSVDTLLALSTWHVLTTKDDPSFPDLAVVGTELVAQIYSSPVALARHVAASPPAGPNQPSPPVALMAPREALAMLADIELVGIVRFDDALDVMFVDLKLRADGRPPA